MTRAVVLSDKGSSLEDGWLGRSLLTSLTKACACVREADEASPFLEILSNDNMRPPARDLGEGGEAR